jgi:membrane associated rhomboid family serine protease
LQKAFGHLRYLAFYVACCFVANATQTAVTLLAGTAAEARVPMLGASGESRPCSRVLGALSELARAHAAVRLRDQGARADLPRARFLYQLIEANYGRFSAGANGGGVAFFAHVGGFIFGVIVARAFVASQALARGRLSSAGY